MEAVIGLVGVALGATLAPVVEWARQRGTRRDERRRELLELVAGLVSASGDQLVAESEMPGADVAWAREHAFRANMARWRLALLGPPEVAVAGDVFAQASDVLGKAIGAAGGWRGDDVAVAYDDWKAAERALIDTARTYLEPL